MPTENKLALVNAITRTAKGQPLSDYLDALTTCLAAASLMGGEHDPDLSRAIFARQADKGLSALLSDEFLAAYKAVKHAAN